MNGAAETRKWVTLWATVVAMFAAAVVFGEDHGPCYEAYLTGGLTRQQMSFEDFSELYSDGVCVTSPVRAAAQDGPENERLGRKDLP